jgi:hypothetical protein
MESTSELATAPHPRLELAERQFSQHSLSVKTGRGEIPVICNDGTRFTSPLPALLRGEGVGGIGNTPIRAEGEGQHLALTDYTPC